MLIAYFASQVGLDAMLGAMLQEYNEVNRTILAPCGGNVLQLLLVALSRGRKEGHCIECYSRPVRQTTVEICISRMMTCTPSTLPEVVIGSTSFCN